MSTITCKKEKETDKIFFKNMFRCKLILYTISAPIFIFGIFRLFATCKIPFSDVHYKLQPQPNNDETATPITTITTYNIDDNNSNSNNNGNNNNNNNYNNSDDHNHSNNSSSTYVRQSPAIPKVCYWSKCLIFLANSNTTCINLWDERAYVSDFRECSNNIFGLVRRIHCCMGTEPSSNPEMLIIYTASILFVVINSAVHYWRRRYYQRLSFDDLVNVNSV